jgi:hypothetical protein
LITTGGLKIKERPKNSFFKSYLSKNTIKIFIDYIPTLKHSKITQKVKSIEYKKYNSIPVYFFGYI